MGFFLLYMVNGRASLWQTNSVLHEEQKFPVSHRRIESIS